jgi:hypothetical protein
MAPVSERRKQYTTQPPPLQEAARARIRVIHPALTSIFRPESALAQLLHQPAVKDKAAEVFRRLCSRNSM